MRCSSSFYKTRLLGAFILCLIFANCAASNLSKSCFPTSPWTSSCSIDAIRIIDGRVVVFEGEESLKCAFNACSSDITWTDTGSGAVYETSYACTEWVAGSDDDEECGDDLYREQYHDLPGRVPSPQELPK